MKSFLTVIGIIATGLNCGHVQYDLCYQIIHYIDRPCFQESQSLLAGDDYTLLKIDKFKAETVDSNESQNLISGSSLISPASGRYRREETFTSSSTAVGSLSLGGDSTKLTPSQTYMAVNRARKRVETATSSSRDDSQESLSSQRQDIPQVKSVNTINRTASSSNGDVKVGNPLNQADLRETFCDRKLETEDIVASNPSSKQKLQLNVDLWPSPDDIEFDDEPASPILSKTPSPSFVFKKSEREFEKSLFGKESELNKLNNIDTESQSCEENLPSLSLASEKQEDLSEFKSIMDSFEAGNLFNFSMNKYILHLSRAGEPGPGVFGSLEPEPEPLEKKTRSRSRLEKSPEPEPLKNRRLLSIKKA